MSKIDSSRPDSSVGKGVGAEHVDGRLGGAEVEHASKNSGSRRREGEKEQKGTKVSERRDRLTLRRETKD